jgi:seryl-tRNA synthetase
MPIDVNLLRAYKGGDPDKVRASEAKRRNKPDTVDEVIRLDREWVESLQKLELCSKEKNKIDAEVKASKSKRPTEDQRARSKELTIQRKQLEEAVELAATRREEAISKIGNVLHPSVPDYAEEKDFEDCVTSWGDFVSPEGIIPHHQALWMLGAYEPEKGSAVAGHRGYYLRGPGVLLNQALINYALSFLVQRGFEPVQPPYFMTKSCMAKVSQLSDFEESLYHVGEVHRGTVANPEMSEEGYFLIATSEQPLCCFHQNENLSEMTLPIKYAGYSPCFRKEAGKFGVDTWGIFRVHQFDKVEQFVVTEPDEEVSYAQLEVLRTNAEDFLKSLNLPFKTINVVSGELNLAAAKKYDINAWFPSLNTHKELVSASNCTDYQSRATDTYVLKSNEKAPVHLLNATLCALTRTMCCIAENHQGVRETVGPDGETKTERGVHIPDVLKPYMSGVTFLPFIRGPRDFSQQKPATKTAARQNGEAVQKEKKKAEKNAEATEEAVVKPSEPAPITQKASVQEPAAETARSPRKSSVYKVAGDTYETFVVELAGKTFDSVQSYVAYLNTKSTAQ